MGARFTAIGICLLVLSVLPGCGGGKQGAALPKLVPVSGTVTLDGKPLSGVTVIFIPAGSTAGRACEGHTDASGRYELMADPKHKGAPVGDFKVVCNKWVMRDGSDFPHDSKQSPLEVDAREKLPPRYSQHETTELKATVPPAGGTIDFPLTSKR